jgi:hypothetical protein
VPELVPPLAACVDYFGHRFLCVAAADVSFNTLAYGSGSDGLLVKDTPAGAAVAQQVAQRLNLKPHAVPERLSGAARSVHLPYTVELHACTGAVGSYVTVTGAGRLMPPDAPGADRIDQVVKLLRPEFVAAYGAGEQLQDGFRMYTSLNPRVCDACNQVILDYEFYNYDKREYDVCVACFNGKGPDAFRYPKNKLRKLTVPESQRRTYWKNDAVRAV